MKSNEKANHLTIFHDPTANTSSFKSLGTFFCFFFIIVWIGIFLPFRIFFVFFWSLCVAFSSFFFSQLLEKQFVREDERSFVAYWPFCHVWTVESNAMNNCAKHKKSTISNWKFMWKCDSFIGLLFKFAICHFFSHLS